MTPPKGADSRSQATHNEYLMILKKIAALHVAQLFRVTRDFGKLFGSNAPKVQTLGETGLLRIDAAKN